MTSEVETNIVAVERIKEYAETEQVSQYDSGTKQVLGPKHITAVRRRKANDSGRLLWKC